MTNVEDAFKKAGYQSGGKDTRPPAAAQPGQEFRLEQNYAAQAEQVILDLKNSMDRDYQKFSTSKIRNILDRVSEIYNDVMAEYDENLSLEMQSRMEYLKVRLVYECGREPKVVKPFVDRAGLLKLLNGIGDSRQRFIDFARYMEALVAYHRFYGGSEIGGRQ